MSCAHFWIGSAARPGVVVLLAALLTASGHNARAADYFYLERPKLGAALKYTLEDDKHITPTSQQQGTSHRFTESLTLKSRGFAYHPALLIFDLSLEPTWEQLQENHEPGQDRSGRDFYLDYGFTGTLFQYRPFSLQLKASQGTSTTSNNLSPSTTREVTSYGANLLYKSLKRPSNLSYQSREEKQKGFYASTESTDTLRLNSSYRTERSSSSMNAAYENRQRDTQGLSQPSDTASIYLRNDLPLTADRRMQLSSSLTTRWTKVQYQTTSSLNLDEYLRWQHTRLGQRLQISSTYSARYLANRANGQTDQTLPLDATLSLTHRLYENLLSSLNLNIGYTSFETGHQTQYGGRLNFDYSRRVPSGMLFLNLGHEYQLEDRIKTADERSVFDEHLTLDDFVITLLANRNVDLESIRVTNADKSVEFVRDFDYTVTATGDFVQIARVPLGGTIANGQTVLASYRYQNDPSAKTGTLTRTFGIGFSLWSTLLLRYNLTMAHEELLDGTPPAYLIDDTTHSVSAQLDYRWSSTLLTYDDEQRAAGNSRRRWKATQNLIWRPRPTLYLNLNGSYAESELPDTGVNDQAYELRARGNWIPASDRQWRLEAFYKNLRSNVPDRIESTGLELSYEWRFRIWSMKINYRFLLDRQPLVDQERTLNTLNLTLTRELF